MQIDKEEIDIFFNEIFYENYTNLKFSYLFKTEAYLLYKNNQFYDFEYRQTIADISFGRKENTGVKKDSQFERPPLKGFWKKHIFVSRNVSMNMISEIVDNRTSTHKEIDKLFEMHNGQPLETIKNELIELLVLGSINNRSAESRMTGEWIIYAEKEEIKYVLTMANHKEGKNQRESDQNIYNRIDKICFNEFPELKKES